MNASPSQVTDVAETIFRYLAAHPDACDSMPGIRDWWLVRQRIEDAERDVVAALRYLVDAGKLEARAGPGGVTVYRARRAPDGGGRR